MAKQKTYIAIDLKSFYASVECKERNRDPLTTNLVVADKSRTEKTICLAVSPSLKSYGIPGRPRLFEVVQKVKEANNTRRWKALNRTFTGSSDDSTELNANPALEIDYIVAPPRMAYYLEYSTKQENEYQQLDLFTDYEAQRKKQAEEEEKLERERRMQEAMLSIKKKFGKNAVLKGMNLEEGATAKDRNEQIGGHKA